jgi:acyl carrier protein
MLDIEEVLIDKIKNEVLDQPGRKLSSSDSLIRSGLIDSFHLVDLALMIEEVFHVKLEDWELNADYFDTIEDLAVLIKTRSN